MTRYVASEICHGQSAKVVQFHDVNHLVAKYLPRWARYMVLAYKVKEETLLQMAYDDYETKKEAEALRKGIEETEDWQERNGWVLKGVNDIWRRLEHDTKIPFRKFHVFRNPNAEAGYLLAFCSSIRLEDDPSAMFCYKTVCPKEHMEEIMAIGRRLGIDDLPRWYIPDQAHITESDSR